MIMFDSLEVSAAVASGGAADQLIYTIRPEDVGMGVRAIGIIPNFANNVTAGLTIRDPDGVVLVSITGWARNASSASPLDVDLHPGDQLYATTSGDIGSGPNICRFKIRTRK